MVLVCCIGINLFSYTKPSTRFPPTQTNVSRRQHRRHVAFASVIPTTTSLTLSSSSLPPLSPISSFSMETGPYEDALNRLSSLITRRVRGDGANRGDQFDLMSRYVQILELEEPISKLKVIHVAGTKGKGSTCSFSESILRNCGFRTGLFTSPHLIDVRERFRLEGVEISEDKFLEYFWWCWNRLEEKADDKVHMPAYFRFLALLAFKIFTSEQVDVAILEVGLGGKYDATNVVQAPVVCGISSLGYDHMEILGNTLAEIAGEKAGIFKKTVPAYTVSQPEEAMRILEDKASQLGIPLVVAPPLNVSLLNSQKLGLDGEHQYVNAGLAICLCRTWLEKTGCKDRLHFDDNSTLPEQFIRGLATATIAGRAQIVEDPHVSMQYQGKQKFGGLAFYLDGAHSPESMEMCARWFSHAAKKDIEQLSQMDDQKDSDTTKHILLFNCMPVRDPQLLLPRLVDVCADKGIYFHKAIFVPNLSVYHKVGSYASPTNDSPPADLSWQQTLQRVWENLLHRGQSRIQGPNDFKMVYSTQEGKRDANQSSASCYESSLVLPSLPSAIRWIRESTQQNRAVRFQVLVTGSLHLVGDVLRLLKK